MFGINIYNIIREFPTHIQAVGPHILFFLIAFNLMLKKTSFLIYRECELYVKAKLDYLFQSVS